jgi:hypothetical protein
MADTHDEALELFESERVVLPDAPPEHMDRRCFDIMLGLLCPNPKRRLSVESLYYSLNDCCVEIPAPTLSIDPPSGVALPRDDRAAMVLRLYGLVPEEHFALAVNIADRYACALNPPRALTDAEASACGALAGAVLSPDSDSGVDQVDRGLVVDVIRRLSFNLYADTVDWVLLNDRRHAASIDYRRIRDVLAETPRTDEAVALYTEPSSRLGPIV